MPMRSATSAAEELERDAKDNWLTSNTIDDDGPSTSHVPRCDEPLGGPQHLHSSDLAPRRPGGVA